MKGSEGLCLMLVLMMSVSSLLVEKMQVSQHYTPDQDEPSQNRHQSLSKRGESIKYLGME